MDFDGTNVIIEKNVEHLGADSMTDYVAHVYVYHGNCQMKYHEEPLMLDAGQCMIVRMQRLLTDVSPSPDFQGTVIYIKPVFIEMSTPRNNYGIRGSLLLSWISSSSTSVSIREITCRSRMPSSCPISSRCFFGETTVRTGK